MNPGPWLRASSSSKQEIPTNSFVETHMASARLQGQQVLAGTSFGMSGALGSGADVTDVRVDSFGSVFSRDRYNQLEVVWFGY